ncbi:two-component system sporulation sensor kinase B [Metabacillus crassostreae]|uniref:sensor histidine kinase n=1 Tax=Metabacillus crassostreae TaxID=929098 RepID=UPI00195696DC|nr:HAMP domain-containing sensor histidine kinase [Metabacillus crassostreae]MBM7605455.1 two-component system sporulation sensor kinase B [Metabacillus crassostreae]
MDLIKDIFLQVAFILFPIFSYHLFWLSKDPSHVLKPNKVIITISTATSSLLCIIWPIEIVDGIVFNLQAIPLFISFVYAGNLAGFLTLLTTFAYLIHSLNFQWFHFLLFILAYSIYSISMKKNWHKKRIKQKLFSSFLYGVYILVIALSSFTIVSALNFYHTSVVNLVTLSVSIIILTFILMIAIYLIEYMRENALLRNELVKAEKLSIVSELAASVAHEVRNPLTVVRGFIQLIGNSTDTNIIQRKEYMDLVISELDRAQSIITDYLSLAGKDYISKEKIHLTNTLRDLTILLTSYANFKAVTFDYNIDDHIYVFGDETKLKQVFINIMKNSIEAVPEAGGLVTVKTILKEENIIVKITDNGIGMTKDQIARLGEPYYTLKETGTGLGLTVTYSILKNHGGTIRYHSELNKGTCAIVTLPLFKENLLITSNQHFDKKETGQLGS